jgi:hypothetical protein
MLQQFQLQLLLAAGAAAGVMAVLAVLVAVEPSWLPGPLRRHLPASLWLA